MADMAEEAESTTDPAEPRSGHAFDRSYWDQHYRDSDTGAHGSAGAGAPNPHLVRETAALTPGAALDAGCGEGAEALWLAEQGWEVTGADIASDALRRARSQAAGSASSGRVRWVEADLGSWEPGRRFDLVTTHYAHPAMPQLDFYDRVAGWVATAGTLLIVGHLQDGRSHGHDEEPGHPPAHDGVQPARPPRGATVTASDITGRLDESQWEVVTAEERSRTVTRGGVEVPLHDVVVRATRIAGAPR